MPYNRTDNTTATGGETVYLGIGSNRGGRRRMIREALTELGRISQTTIEALSPLYYSEPVEGAGPGEFINGVVGLRTTLAPTELLAEIEQIESVLGRRSKGDSQPRTIDLDILLFGKRVIAAARLHVPHPRMTRRVFVMQPLFDLAPAATIPPKNRTVAEVWQELIKRDGIRPALDIDLADLLPGTTASESRR